MTRKTHTIDVKDKALGRAASQVALLLRGKNKVTFKPNLDEGDFVVIKNVDQLKFTGKKFEQKTYKHHTNYPGHLRTKFLKDLYVKKPQWVFKNAVIHMLPDNKLRRAMMKRLSFE